MCLYYFFSLCGSAKWRNLLFVIYILLKKLCKHGTNDILMASTLTTMLILIEYIFRIFPSFYLNFQCFNNFIWRCLILFKKDFLIGNTTNGTLFHSLFLFITYIHAYSRFSSWFKQTYSIQIRVLIHSTSICLRWDEG